MLDILRFPLNYRYPHYHWVGAIEKVLSNAGLGNDVTFVDAPCGVGGISYWLIKRKIGTRYELLDISERAIQIAKPLQAWSERRGVEMSIDCKDIFDLDNSTPSNDVWLLINSLFLLPDADRLVEHMSNRAEHIVGLFPHIDRRNYLQYVARKPRTNTNPLNQEDTIAFFKSHGYQLREKQDVTFIPFYCIPTNILRFVAIHFLNPIEYVVPKREGFYWVGLFSKHETRQ